MLYRVGIKKYTMVGTKMLDFDHWVTLEASNETEARIKGKKMLATQMLYGKNWEYCLVLNKVSKQEIEKYIDNSDLEVVEN